MADTTMNEPVAKTVMTITMLHPQDINPVKMSDIDVANQMSIGAIVGQRTTLETEQVNDSDVDQELQALGIDAGYFANKGPFVRTEADA